MYLLFRTSALRKHDVVFLVTVRPTQRGPVKYDRTKPFREQVILLQRGSTEVVGSESGEHSFFVICKTKSIPKNNNYLTFSVHLKFRGFA